MSGPRSMLYPHLLLLCRSQSAPWKTGPIVLTRAASSLGALWVARAPPISPGHLLEVQMAG